MNRPHSEHSNRLLALLSEDDLAVLAPHLEAVDLPKSTQIAKAGDQIEHCYFIEEGLGSVVSTTPEGFNAEVGMVGRDGILPTSPVMACTTTAQNIVMQIGGNGFRVETPVLMSILEQNAAMRRLLLRFVQTLATQTSFTALSNAVHHTEERLARWLLMCHDRMDGKQLALTHEYIAILLAVRRPSVTTALHILEGNHLIYSKRGLITIRDREGLEKFAADAYGVPEAEYARLIGPMRSAS